MRINHYRPEIDGLRALAVTSVIAFHAGFMGFAGGFIGVDIFFVISGFLITSIILRELKAGSFSLVRFWERRIRRIVPALTVVLVASCGAAYFLLLYPTDYIDFGKSLFAQSIFLSNFFFLKRDTYFSEPAEISPLLHTWTLSVEEQFYILLPVLLVVTWAFFKKKIPIIFFVLGACSFMVSAYLVDITPLTKFNVPLLGDVWGGATNQTAGFYLLPTRAWEFIVGALIAVFGLSAKSKITAETMSILGIMVILYAVTQFDSATAFPGVAALLPVLGSGAFIVANANMTTVIGRIFSSRVFVWLGLISYSLYLWHWPVFVFSGVLLGEYTFMITIVLILLSVCLAWLTYTFVEIPFRVRKYFPQRRMVFGVGFSILIILAGIGYTMWHANTEGRLPAYARGFFEAEMDKGPRYMGCFREKTVEDYEKDGPCILGEENPDMPVKFVVWGDSHSGAVLDTIDHVAELYGVQGAYFAGSACLPVLGAHLPNIRDGCDAINEMAAEYLITHDIGYVLLVSKWEYYLAQYSDRCLGCIFYDQMAEVTEQEYRQVFKEYLTKMLGDMHKENRAVYIMKQVPFHESFNLRELVYSSIRNSRKVELGTLSLIAHREHVVFTDEVFKKLSDDGLAHIIDPTPVFCSNENGCIFETEDKQLYRDASHLNFTGSSMLMPMFDAFMKKVQ